MTEDPFGAAPKRDAAAHTVGQDLSALSVHELDERIVLLEAEIERLKTARAGKEASREAAAAIFRL